jgi:pseudaminic acid cytidylyltransferase
MSAIAIIPARGGSRRIPRKNIRLFCGRPIIHHAIQTALDSGIFAEVLVSTDDAEIAEVARAGGASVPFLRTAENSSDTATTASVLVEVLSTLDRSGRLPERFCCIYPATPLLRPEVLVESARVLDQPAVHSVQPVVRFGFPPQRAFRVGVLGMVEWVNPEHALTRSQDLEPQFHDAGQFYWWKTREFLRAGRLLGERSAAYEISELDAQDIDNETDWKLAEQKFLLRNNV